MQMQSGGLRRSKAFATEAGVSVRTLHLYDRLGLLRPAALSPSGYRLYGEAELERLEHILALRFVGLRLDQIKELLGGPEQPLIAALRMQREVIARQKQRLESALTLIEEAERALIAGASADRWKILRTVMEGFKMQNDWKWAQEYYSEAAREKIDERRRTVAPDVVEQGQRDWTILIAEVEAAVCAGIEPSGAQARALAHRWRDLVASFTRGDGEVERGLNRLWSDQTHWPKDFKRPWSDAADGFIKQAMGCDGNGAVDGD